MRIMLNQAKRTNAFMIDFEFLCAGGEPVAVTSESVGETEALGASLGRHILASGENPVFIAMKGDLGAGKTAFVRGLASVLSAGSPVRSPTYAIVNEYSRGALPLYHFDLYRIADADDLYSVGFYDYIENGISVAEWSENAEDELPMPRYEVSVIGSADEARTLRFAYIK